MRAREWLAEVCHVGGRNYLVILTRTRGEVTEGPWGVMITTSAVSRGPVYAFAADPNKRYRGFKGAPFTAPPSDRRDVFACARREAAPYLLR